MCLKAVAREIFEVRQFSACLYTILTSLPYAAVFGPTVLFLCVFVLTSINHVSVTFCLLHVTCVSNADTRIISTLWHVPLVSILTGFY